MLPADALLVRDPRCAGRVIDGRAAVVTPHDNRLHLLNATGTAIWRRAQRACTFDELVSALTVDYEVSAEIAKSDLATFISTLLERRILRVEEPQK